MAWADKQHADRDVNKLRAVTASVSLASPPNDAYQVTSTN